MDKSCGTAHLGLVDAAVLPVDELPLLPGKGLPKGYRSAVVGLFPYYTGQHPGRNLSLYAVGPDYHGVVKGMLNRAAERLSQLHPGLRSRSFVDASPIDEVRAARHGGLGQIGRNGMLIAPRWGQFVFIGCLLTDLEPDAVGLASKGAPTRCTGCGACLRACPTGALGGGGVDVARCRSAITQKPGLLTEWEAASLRSGGFVWGCDACLLACPHNRSPEGTPIAAFYEDLRPCLGEADLDTLSDRAYLWRGLDPLRRNLALLSTEQPQY